MKENVWRALYIMPNASLTHVTVACNYKPYPQVLQEFEHIKKIMYYRRKILSLLQTDGTVCDSLRQSAQLIVGYICNLSVTRVREA